MRSTRNTAAKNKKLILIPLFVLLLVAAIGLCLSFMTDRAQTVLQSVTEPEPLQLTEQQPVRNESEQEQQPESEPEPVVRTVKYSAAGDNLIHGMLYMQAQSRASGTDKEYDFTSLYEKFAPFLADYDVNFINQETLVTDEIAPATYPCFATPGEVGREIYRLGWRVFGTSNNHIYDQGALGITSTLRFWDGMPDDLVTVGLYRDETDEMTLRIGQANGITFAYLAYTQYTNGIPTPTDAEAHIIYTSQTELIEQQITAAKQQADVVVVSVHWGVEDSHEVTEEQRQLAASMAGWGADIIIGTHPHVIQTIEMLENEDGRKTLCAYSLGNFVSAQSRPDELIGIVLSFDVQMDEADQLEISHVQAHPTVTHYGSGYSNVQVLCYKDYTAELAQTHGVRNEYPVFSYDYVRSVIEKYIPAEYISWEN